MTGRWAFGRRMWLIICFMLAAALVLLVMAQTGVQDEGGMTELEQRLSATLERVEGAGHVRAMVLCDAPAGAFGQTMPGDVRGVIIVAEGAYDLGVKLRLQSAAMTLFSLTADDVEVLSGREEDGR